MAKISFSSSDPFGIADSLRQANTLKAEGNDLFRASRWHEAIAAYRSALSELPERIAEASVAPVDPITSEKVTSEDVQDGDRNPAKDELSKNDAPALSPGEEEECARVRAVLNANVGACYVKLGDHKQAVDACSEALSNDPNYVKALQRRAASNEIINTWSSLTAAQEDYTTLLKLLPPSSLQLKETERSLLLLKPRVEDAQKRETGEMLDKLKGLGNSILGNFGLSTDNFKFVPNGEGGYSVNFSR